ncbi:MAG: hypothetical protein GXY38_05420 [Planctomycetes bacterium]|nr:hypothetical protein [Planctomycetota bacterium]
MTFQLFKGYMMAISTGLIIVAAIVLVALQWAKPAQMTIYGKDVEPTTLVVIVASAVGGILLVLLARASSMGWESSAAPDTSRASATSAPQSSVYCFAPTFTLRLLDAKKRRR